VKRWCAGVADEAWKVAICARDAAEAGNLLASLASLLVDGNVDALKQMSGREIVDGLIARQKASMESIENGLKR